MRQLATTSSDKTIKLWNLDGFSLDRTLTGEHARCLIACGHAACKQGMCMPHGRSLEASLMPQTDLLPGLLHSRWLLCLVAAAPGVFLPDSMPAQM